MPGTSPSPEQTPPLSSPARLPWMIVSSWPSRTSSIKPVALPELARHRDSASVEPHLDVRPLLQVHRIDEAHLPLVQGQNHRPCAHTFPEKPHALQQVSVRHSRARENHFLARRQICGVVNALQILHAHFCQSFRVFRLAHHQPCKNLPVQAAQRRSRKRAPAARISSMSFSCRGRSSTITTRSSTSRSSLLAIAFRLSATGASRSTAPLHDGPTTSFSMYRSGACSN